MDDKWTWANKGTSGSFQPKNAKLTPQQRHDISRRLAEGETPMDLAVEYQVSIRTIRGYK